MPEAMTMGSVILSARCCLSHLSMDGLEVASGELCCCSHFAYGALEGHVAGGAVLRKGSCHAHSGVTVLKFADHLASGTDGVYYHIPNGTCVQKWRTGS